MNNNVTPLISIVGLCKRFGQRSVLEDVHLSIGRNETVALIGPSGGGKSTLLRSINALNYWDAGEIRVGPYTLQAEMAVRRDGAAVRQVRRLLGMIFQDFQLFPHFTAAHNVAEAPRQVLGMKSEAARARAHELLERVGLAAYADSYPHQLSGGQKQRVAIARALAMQPHGLLCDEITSALDPELKHEVLDVVADLKRDGMALLLVTHEIGFARRAADRVVVLADGRIIEEGPPSQVLDAPRHERTRQFLANVLA